MKIEDGESGPRELGERKIARLKQEAKAYKKSAQVTHLQALDTVAANNGFTSWRELIAEGPQPGLPKPGQLEINLPLSQQVGPLTAYSKKALVERNSRFLTSIGVEFSTFVPTETGLSKSILDATFEVRSHFRLASFHDYAKQGQGGDCKFVCSAFLVTPEALVDSRASFYRPNTKKGDPRMWFGGLGGAATSGDVCAIVIHDGSPYILNISTVNLEESLSVSGVVAEFLRMIQIETSDVAAELLSRLKCLSGEYLYSEQKGDTAVGMAVERALGIAANSDKAPDYKGIELKSGRGSGTRTTLFAQVPNWKISPCASSREILDNYGYQREEDFKLYCSVSAVKPNSQGLYFEFQDDNDLLAEKHITRGDVALWSAEVLRTRLLEKHAETFWIQAESCSVDGEEAFKLKSVIHTKGPLRSRFIPLIKNGTITMDHLIKRNGKTGRVSEKGPLFKINKSDLELLFPKPVEHELA